MKRVLLLTTIGVLCFIAMSRAQNVFDPADPIIRYDDDAPLGSDERPNPGIGGLQKWVSVPTRGVSTGGNAWNASSFKSYFINLGGAQMAFRLKYPKSFTNPDSAGKKYPVMVFFHGAGEPGCPRNGGIYNNENHLVHGGRTFRDRVDNGQFDGFLLYPQALAGSNCWSDWGIAPYSPYYNLFLAVLDSVSKYARLDIDKVLVTGLSNGGTAAWSITNTYPQRIAKAAPSASATGYTELADLVHIPIWFASGGKDTNPTPGLAGATYDGLKNAGSDVVWTLFPDLGHGVWNQHWALPGFVDFMNDIHKANPLVFFQRYDWCPDSAISVKLGITRGFYEYEWERDGQTIATATRTGSNYPYTYSHNISAPQYVINFTANDVTVNDYGTYRVRFRRSAGGPWSEWSPKPAVIYPKPITQTPPIVVDGLHSKVLQAPDGSTTVPLILPPGYPGYEWYHNDALISTDSLINASPGSYKAKILENFGCGSLFSPVFNVATANGEPKPDPATNLKTAIENLVNVRLTWDQNPNSGQNETGFEIYRAPAPGGPYTLMAIAPTDAGSYVDENLPSNTNFYYIVRAVSDFGAAASSNEAPALTPVDNIAPTAPSGLELTCVTREKVTLRWNASTDNVGVSVYDIYMNGVKVFSTPNTRAEIFQLTPLTNFAITVKAKDPTGNSSEPGNQVTAYTKAQGLCYKVYEGDWNALPDFNTLTPVKEGMSPNVDLSVRPAGVNERFGIVWEGHIFRVPGDAGDSEIRRFQICSDDGSRLYYNGYYDPASNGTINNDGLHGNTCVAAGSNVTMEDDVAYPIALAFFEKTGGEAMTLNWRIGGSTDDYDPVPASAFTEAGDPPGTIPDAPSGLTADGVNYHTINLSWTDNSDDETGFEIVRSSSLNGVYDPLATVTGNSYSDTGLDASTTYFYKVRAINEAGQSAFTTAASAATQAAPPPPAAPTDLVANVPALATIQLTWNDNSTDETGFEIWRSVGNNTNFTLLTTVPGGAGSQKAFEDAPVFANVHYFYKVRAAGSPNVSEFTGEANAATANTAPVLNAVANFTVRQGTSISVPVTATDIDGDPLVFTSPNMPFFATIENVSNGNATIVANPPAGIQGVFNVRIIVSDGFNGYDTVKYTMVVNNNSVPTIDPITDVVMNEGDSVVMGLSAQDDATTSYMTWSFVSKPDWVTFTDSSNGKGSLKLKPHYAASGIYNMTVKVSDGFGAWTTTSFNIVVNETDPNETIQVNMRYFSGFQPLWNDVPVAFVNTFNVPDLRNKKDEVTTVGINLVSADDILGTDHGMQPGGAGIFPDPIMKDQLKVGYNGGSDVAELRVYGLDPDKKYNFIFFASDAGFETWRGYDANTVTTYTINGINAQVHVLQNINETDTIYQVQPNASGEVFITMTGDPSPLIGAILNALVIDAQVDDGTTPLAPGNLAGMVIPNVGVRLTWTDISYNENSYSIFRSENIDGPYTALSPDAKKDSTNYIDANVEPYTQYFYYIQGVNHLGLGASSDTVTVTTGNNKPAINGLDNLYVKTNGSAQEDFAVADDPADIITVTILNKPSFVTLTSLGGGNYRITAEPTSDDIGWHNLTIQATDNNGGLITQSISLNVADQNTRSVYVNFAWFIPAAAPWNNIMGYGNAGATLNNLVDETNVPTPFGIQLIDGWLRYTDNGHRTGNNSGVFPDSVLAGGLMHLANETLQLRFTGLNNAMRYNLTIVSSQNEGVDATIRYASGSQSDTLNARNNTNGTANLNGLTPSGGEIVISINRLSGSYTFLNGIQLEEYDPSITLMSPANLYVEPGMDRTSVAVIWSDRSANETGFLLQRATDSLFTQNVVDINFGQGTSAYTNTGLTPNTKYWYRVRANGTAGAVSGWSNRAKVITPQNVVYVNLNFSIPGSPAPWNNLDWNPIYPGTITGLKNQSSSPTNITLAIEAPFSGENITGLTTGSGIVPDNVMESSYWIDRAGHATIRLGGLNLSKRYRIGFTANINDEVFGGIMTMTYTVNGRTVYLNGFLNSTKMVYIGDLVPDENGELLIECSTPDKDDISFGFISALVIQSYDDVQGGTVPNIVNAGSGQDEVVLQTRTELPVVSLEQDGISLKMYPNPFRDVINLDFNNTSGSNNIGVDIYDLSGRLVYRRNFGRMAAGFTTLRVNAADGRLNAGVYMVTLTVNGRPVQANKMIKGRN